LKVILKVEKTKIASEETPMIMGNTTVSGSTVISPNGSLPTPTQNLKILGVLSRNSYPILKTGDRGTSPRLDTVSGYTGYSEGLHSHPFCGCTPQKIFFSNVFMF